MSRRFARPSCLPCWFCIAKFLMVSASSCTSGLIAGFIGSCLALAWWYPGGLSRIAGHALDQRVLVPAPDHTVIHDRGCAGGTSPLPAAPSLVWDRHVPQLAAGLLLHAGGVDPTGWLWSDWNIEPTIAIGLLALVAGYLFITGPAVFSQKASFIAGALVLFVALGPPLMIGPITISCWRTWCSTCC